MLDPRRVASLNVLFYRHHVEGCRVVLEENFIFFGILVHVDLLAPSARCLSGFFTLELLRMSPNITKLWTSSSQIMKKQNHEIYAP